MNLHGIKPFAARTHSDKKNDTQKTSFWGPHSFFVIFCVRTGRPNMRVGLLLLAVASVKAWAPLDGLASLFGTAPLNSPEAVTKRPYPLNDVAHEACHVGMSGCVPAGGCDALCKPRVGHYWPVGEAALMPSYLGFLSAVLPPIAPPYHMMTERGILEGRPTFWLTTYRLLVSAPPVLYPHMPRACIPAFSTHSFPPSLQTRDPSLAHPSPPPLPAVPHPIAQDEPADSAADSLPGVHVSAPIAWYVCVPGTILFFAYVAVMGRS